MSLWPFTLGLGDPEGIFQLGLEGSSTGTVSTIVPSFNPAISDMVLEAFDRIEIRPTSLTRHQLRSAYRSINFAFSTWANRGVNLWTVDLLSIPLVQGQVAYDLPADTVMVRDVYVRSFQMGTPVNLPCAFSVTSGNANVTVGWPSHGLQVGSWVNFIVPIAIAGIIVFGFYSVISVPSSSTFIIAAANIANASITGGTTPVFTTAQGSGSVTVALGAHGLLAGQIFPVSVSTSVGGLILFGDYVVQAVLDADTFTIVAATQASDNATGSENNGLFQAATQAPGVLPVDRLLYPMSRNDYAAIPNKFTQGTVNSFWFNRESPIPVMVLYFPPANTGPQVLMVYRNRQIQTASLQGGATADIPYRFLEACVSDLTARLAQKFAPAKWVAMAAEARAQWAEAASEDSERVSMFIGPDLSGYFV